MKRAGRQGTRKQLLTLLMLTVCLMHVSAQVTISVSAIPKNTKAKDSIFIAGTFNNWNTKDEKMQLILQKDGSYSITFIPALKYFEYKFTRGDWSSVEGDKNGNTIPNRKFSYDGKPSALDLKIESWVDLEIIKIRVVNLPLNTPDDVSLYMAGPFNQWNPADPNYKLERLQNGAYQFVLPHADSISFKFTRGSFSSMESNGIGSTIASRILVPSKLEHKTVEYQIEGWEDLSESAQNSFEDILMIATYIGFLVSLALYFIRNPRKEANNILSIILIIISLTLISRILLYYQYFIYQTPKLILVPLFLLFAVSPLINIYSKGVLHFYDRIDIRQYLIFFIPLLVLMIALLPLLIVDKNHLVTLLLNHQLDTNFKIVGGIGILYNGYYLFESFKMLRRSKQIEGDASVQGTHITYIQSLLFVGTFITLILALTFLSAITSFEHGRLGVEWGITISWLALCLYPFTIVWFVIVRPEIFSLNFEARKAKSKDSSVAMKAKLDELMENKKPFIDPELSLNELAGLLHTNSHVLSRLINENETVNFYDFINGYRIEEFKKRCENGQHKTMTIIAIANEVGFRSKTTFNRTFKKMNKVTPREYLNTLKSELA